jgi:uncharacterized delta-60 repeat protein
MRVVFVALCAALLLSAAATARPGQLSATYGSNGGASLAGDTRIVGSATQADGKLVVVGEAGTKAGQVRMLVARLTSAGKPDPKFHGGQPYLGAVGTTAHAVTIQSDGKIVVAGSSTDPSGSVGRGMLVLRLTTSGSPDRSFSGDGLASALTSQAGEGLSVAVQSNGKIVIGGDAKLAGTSSDAFARISAARFNANGAPDGGFGQGGVVVLGQLKLSFANGVAVQPNGRIILAGSHRNNLQSTEVLVIRLTANGAVDGSFNGDGFFVQQFAQGAASSAVYAVALAPGGKIVLGGSATSSTTGGNALAVRLTGAGNPDGSFSGDGSVLVPASQDADQYGKTPLPGARALVLSGGDIILAGHFDSLGLRQAAVWALTSNGSLDSRFGQGGRTVFPSPPGRPNFNPGAGQSQFDALAAASDGSLLAGGNVQDNLDLATAGLVVKLAGFPVPVQLNVKVKSSYRLGPALRQGIPVKFTCNEQCTLSAVLKALGGVVAKANGKLGAAGSKILKLHFTRAGKNKLADEQRVVAKLISTAKGGGKTDKVTRKIVLH